MNLIMPTGGENLMRELFTPTRAHAAVTAALYLLQIASKPQTSSHARGAAYTAGPSLVHHVAFGLEARA